MKRALLLMLFVAGTASAEPAPKSVTLDVKDEDVRVILKTMQTQCAVKNLLIDEDVEGKGTIYFRDVPCRTAFAVVLRQFGLVGTVEQNIVAVEKRER